MRKYPLLPLLLLLSIGFSFGQETVQILNGGFEEVLFPPVTYTCTDGNLTTNAYQPKYWDLDPTLCCYCYQDLLNSPSVLVIGVSTYSHSGSYSNAIIWTPQSYWSGRVSGDSAHVKREQEIPPLSGLTYRVKGYYRQRVWINDNMTNVTDIDANYYVYDSLTVGGITFRFVNSSTDWVYFEAVQYDDGTCELVSGEGIELTCSDPVFDAYISSWAQNLTYTKDQNITEIEFLLDDIELEIVVPSLLERLYDEYTDFSVLPIKDAEINMTEGTDSGFLPDDLSHLYVYAGKDITGMKTYLLNVSWDANYTAGAPYSCGIHIENVTLYYENGTMYGAENSTTFDFFELNRGISEYPSDKVMDCKYYCSGTSRPTIIMPVPKEVNRVVFWLSFHRYYSATDYLLGRGYIDLTVATENLVLSNVVLNDSALNKSLPVYYPNPIISFVKEGNNVVAYHVGLAPVTIRDKRVHSYCDPYPYSVNYPRDEREVWFKGSLLESYTDTNTTLGDITEHITDFTPYYYTEGDEVHYLGDEVDFYGHVYRPESIYIFGESYPVVSCPSYCYGANYYEGSVVDTECSYTVYTCDERCIPDLNVSVIGKGDTWVKFNLTSGFDSYVWWVTEAGEVVNVTSGTTSETILTVVGLATNKSYDMHVKSESYLGCPTYRYGETSFTLGTVYVPPPPPAYVQQTGTVLTQMLYSGATMFASMFGVSTSTGYAILWLFITLAVVYIFAFYLPSALDVKTSTEMIAVLVFLLMSVIGAISGMLPTWVALVIIVLTAGVFAYMMKQAFG